MEVEVGQQESEFARVLRDMRVAERKKRSGAAARKAAERRASKAQKQTNDAQKRIASAERLSGKQRSDALREARTDLVTAREAEVAALNSELERRYHELDNLLEATLSVDDHVDLEVFRAQVSHPPFEYDHLREPLPMPEPIPDPAPPVRQAPARVRGIFGRKRKRQQAMIEVENRYAADYAQWQHDWATLPNRRAAQAAEYEQREAERRRELEARSAEYQNECAEREAEASRKNSTLDELIAGLGYGTPSAVNEYIEIVLANSVYPEGFNVEHEAQFEPATAELSLQVQIPAPDQVPSIKTYRYVKKDDAITETQLSQKMVKDRYNGIVESVALRSLHEVFEADRRGIIRAISLELGTRTIDPATGHEVDIPFVAVATDRDTFTEIDLSAVVPSATLEYLGAAVSKNARGLVPVTSSGVRRAK